MDDPVERLDCQTYTHARRHPIVIGQIGGWAPPFQLTLTQIAALFLTFAVELKTWSWWAPYLPRPFPVLVAVTVAVAVSWLIRRVRIEGRSVIRAAGGLVMLLLTPATGTSGGRRHRLGPPTDLRRSRIYVAPRRPGS